jgi:ornithine cyclodeaminase
MRDEKPAIGAMEKGIPVYSEAQLRACISLNKDMIDLVENAFSALSKGNVIMPPIMSMDIAERNAEVDVKTAYIPGLDAFAVKISPGFFDNPKIGLPSLNGLMVLLSAQTGIVKAVFLDNGYLTDIRTAAAGGVAARHLAPKNVKTAGVIGTGVQARLQIYAAFEERRFENVLVWGRNPKRAQECALEIENHLGVKTTATDEIADLVAQSQLVITTTPSREPLIKTAWLHENLHITAMGADQEGKTELDPKILGAADRFVCDRIAQSERLGELRHAINAGEWTDAHEAVEIGDIISNEAVGRQSEKDITICDLTGTGAQDTAISNFAFDLMERQGLQ